MAVRAVLPTDDAALTRACVDGDPEAFALLYQRYFPDLVRFLVRRGNDHGRAEDIAQETLARAYRYLPGFDASRPVWPWLRTIAARVAGTEAAARTAEVLVYEAPDGTADDPVEALAARDVLVESLRRLPDRQRDALVLRYVEDRHPADVAAVLGMNRNSFEQLLWRARRGLAREYSRLSGAVLVPLSLRLRRAAYWADTRVGAAFSGAIASAGSAAASVAVVVGVSVTAVTGTAHVSDGSPLAVEIATPDTPSLAGVGLRPISPDPASTRPGAGTPAVSPARDVVVERGAEVGPAAARSRFRMGTDPTRKGTVQEDDTEVDTGHTQTNTGGDIGNDGRPGLICAATGICL